jgi:hypothetical protein
MYLLRQGVVGVGVVDPCRGDVVELLARAGCGLGDVDDLEDLGTAEAGDLHGSHAGEARRGRDERTSLGQSCSPNWATTIEKCLGGAARSGID